MPIGSKWIIALAPALFVPSACQLPSEGAGAAPPSAPSAEICPQPGPAYLLWTGSNAVEVGESVLLVPYHSPYPGAMTELPAACLDEVTVSPASAARVETHEDGGPVLVIEDNVDGPVAVRAVYGGALTLSAVLDVYDPADVPLAGYWRQEAGACASGAPIRELIFEPAGTFSVTWTPFETYKDYWGRYDYAEDAGTLTLMPEGGNHMPADIASGTIDVEDETMTLESASFGSPPHGPRCDAPFQRYRLP